MSKKTTTTKAPKNAKATTEAKVKKAAAPKADKPMSGLDAAAKVLAEVGEPMNIKAVVEAAMAKGYWTSKGATPWATVYSAVIREIVAKKETSRFRKTAKGMFELAK